jgi:integrase
MTGSGETRKAVPLTARAIEALKPEGAPYRVPDERCRGLAVRVAPSGLRTWDLTYRIKGTGRIKRLSLGRVGDLGLEHARDRANQLTSAARQGRDLVVEEDEIRETKAREITVRKLVDLYLGRRVKGRLRTAKEIESRLRRTLAPLIARKASEIRRRDLRELFDAAADQGFLREAGQRRQAVSAMFRWGLSQDLVESDPSAGLNGDSYSLGQPRDRILADEEVEKLWLWIGSGALPSSTGDVLKLQLCLGARCGEVSGIRDEEIDSDKWLWLLPAERSKNKRPRTTPIIGMARVIIEGRLAGSANGPLFPSETGEALYSGIIGQHIRVRWDRLPLDRFSTHDLRRTVATRMAEMGVALDLVAAVIGHESGAKDIRTLSRHYLRTDLIERKQNALVAWDERLRRIIAGEVKAAANVVEIHRQAG